MSALVQFKEARKELMSQLEKTKPILRDLLPPEMSADRLIRVVQSCVTRTPSILECEVGSVVRAVIQGAECGLEIGGVFGEAYLVPFRNRKHGGRKEAQFIAGYKGLIKLALQSEGVRNIEAHVVYKGDAFDYTLGTTPNIMHRPAPGSHNPDDVAAAYAIAFFDAGGMQAEVMSREDLENIRRRSKAKDDGPWVTDTVEMYRKCPARRIMKYLRLSPRAKAALEYDEEREHPARERVEGPTRGDALKARIAGGDEIPEGVIDVEGE